MGLLKLLVNPEDLNPGSLFCRLRSALLHGQGSVTHSGNLVSFTPPDGLGDSEAPGAARLSVHGVSSWTTVKKSLQKVADLLTPWAQEQALIRKIPESCNVHMGNEPHPGHLGGRG